MGLTGFEWVWMGLTGFYWVLLGFTGLNRALSVIYFGGNHASEETEEIKWLQRD